jgi:hypothetical protein
MSGLSPPERAREIAYRTERRLGGLDPTRKSGGHLLQHPAIAVRVGEHGVGAVALMIWRDAADLPSEWTRTGSVMENFAHLGATPHQLVARRLNVGDNQEQSLGRARLAVLSEVNGTGGARG